MRRFQNALLGLIALMGAVRAGCYLAYAAARLGSPLEGFHLEAAMVHLAWRARSGLPLYPDDSKFPHVSNIYGPLYFGLVGLRGRAAGADLDGLFRIGRAISFASGLALSGIVGVAIGRRFGRAPAIVGAIVSLGAAPMYGFSVMVRPDLLAQALGVSGFLLAAGRSRGRAWAWAGGALLVLAFFTKQTAGSYLLATLLACLAQGRARRAIAIGLGYAAALAGTFGAITLALEPRIVAGMLSEGRSPWELETWLKTVGRLADFSPDLLVVSGLGLLAWLAARPREVGMAALAIVALAVGLVTAGKFGSDLNYLLDLRVVEALAVGTFWARARAGRSPRVTAAALVVIAASLAPSVWYAGLQANASRAEAAFFDGPAGRSVLESARQVFRTAEDPSVRLLTDAPLVALHQGERAAFPDPFLFRSRVETGQIAPTALIETLEAAEFDLLVLTAELDAPSYETYEFGLPGPLIEPARRRYRLLGRQAGYFLYGRRSSPAR